MTQKFTRTYRPQTNGKAECALLRRKLDFERFAFWVRCPQDQQRDGSESVQSGNRGIHCDLDGLFGAVVHDGERFYLSAIAQLIEHEVHAPNPLGCSGPTSGWRSVIGSFLRRRLRTDRPSSR